MKIFVEYDLILFSDRLHCQLVTDEDVHRLTFLCIQILL